MGGGGRVTGTTHEERSKIMNSSAFSGPDSAVRFAQHPGNEAWIDAGVLAVV
jgi:hypothetical protein